MQEQFTPIMSNPLDCVNSFHCTNETHQDVLIDCLLFNMTDFNYIYIFKSTVFVNAFS